jgi:hypothetical protein
MEIKSLNPSSSWKLPNVPIVMKKIGKFFIKATNFKIFGISFVHKNVSK